MSFFTPVRETDPQQAMSSTSSPVAFLTSPFFPSRKRRAPSPPSSPQQPIFPHQSGSTSSHVDHHGKRRRPNLANGFSGLTINARSVDRASSPLPSYEDSQATHHEVDDDEAISRSRLDLGDVRVEELPNFPRFPRRGDSTSSSSTTPADEDYDSDSTYRLPSRSHRYAGVAQQADQVVQPNRESSGSTNLDVEDVTDQTPVRGRKRRDDFEDDLDAGWKQSRWDMDLDADMDMSDSELPEIPRMERQRRRTEWHEPEKDRIVITSLGSPSSSRSSSSDRSSSRLTQPGSRGFTLSPSFLTHLLASRRDQLGDPFLGQKQEQGLVLYRPPPLPPRWTEEIVRRWGQIPEATDDVGRIEEMDDDEVGHPDAEMMDIEDEMDMDIG